MSEDHVEGVGDGQLFGCKLLRSHRRAWVGGVVFDFNPPGCPQSEAALGWRPEPFTEWLTSELGVCLPIPATAADAGASGVYQGCLIHAVAARVVTHPERAVLEDVMLPDECVMSLKLREPSGNERALVQTFSFYRDAGGEVGLEGIRTRIARATGPDGAGLAEGAKLAWQNASEGVAALDAELDKVVLRIGELTRGGDPDESIPLVTVGPDQAAVIELVQQAVALGYKVRSAELENHAKTAEAGKAVREAGKRGGKKSAKTRGGQMDVRYAWARDLLDKYKRLDGWRTVSDLMKLINDDWNHRPGCPPELSATTLRAFIKSELGKA